MHSIVIFLGYVHAGLIPLHNLNFSELAHALLVGLCSPGSAFPDTARHRHSADTYMAFSVLAQEKVQKKTSYAHTKRFLVFIGLKLLKQFRQNKSIMCVDLFNINKLLCSAWSNFQILLLFVAFWLILGAGELVLAFILLYFSRSCQLGPAVPVVYQKTSGSVVLICSP